MDGIGWAAAAMSAARSRLDVAAENLANGSADGFRKTALQGTLTEWGVRMRSITVSTAGPLRRTGRKLDLAIAGPGAFRVRDAHGHVTLTRNGAFSRDRSGHLIDGAGRMLLGTRGPVIVAEGAGVPSACIPLPRGASLRSGYLEASNVDAISEMIDLMTAQRSFETAQKVLSAIDQTRERAATQVAAVKG
jgi:flagellar basal-body rod protein FlgG